uniref:Uncharacterized protein n=1 Tax=Anopheles funestus TaxID=62324 RepID=A0A182S4B6_ANOFN
MLVATFKAYTIGHVLQIAEAVNFAPNFHTQTHTRILYTLATKCCTEGS